MRRNKIATSESNSLGSEAKETVIASSSEKKAPEKNKITLKEKYSNFKAYLNKHKRPVKFVTIGCTIFVVILASISNMQIGYAVIYNDETIGYVTQRDDTKSKIEKISEDLAMYNQGGETLNLDPQFNPSFVPASKFTDANEIVSIIKDSLGLYVDGCVFLIDGQPQFALKSEQEANEVLERYRAMNTGDGEIVSVELGSTVTFRNEQIPYAEIVSVDEAVSIIAGTNSEDDLYTVQEGDTIWSICMAHDVMTDYVIEVNNLESETILPGQKLRVIPPEPLIDVIVKKKISYVEYQPNETKYEYDQNLEKDKKQTIQEGHQGETQVEAIVTLCNLSETDREILSQQVLTEPVDTIIKVGTKPKPTNAPTGTFMRPVGGYVSSAFGSRSRGNHTGIDYANPMGTPVKAADGGTVTAAGWSGGYGYMVKINHGNGYETLYAHNSKLAVKVGDKVAKGQVISYVGSTGNSTGPHLHFEIRKNGAYLNPANYV